MTMSSTHTTGSQDAKANMPFIRKNSLYSTEKAYNADVFTANISPSNVKTEMIRDIQITDLRPHKDSFCFNQHGFEILNFTSSLDPADWSDQQKVESVYCRELGQMMKKHLGASAIQVFETQVRKRHPTFPYEKVQSGVSFQPAMRPHIDSSHAHTIEKIKMLNGDAAAGLLQGRWTYFNVWKPLNGPLRDWPLSICDPSSVSESTDLIPMDNIVRQQYAENVGVHYNQQQKWMYLSNHMPDELLVFRQADSDGNTGVPHASFELEVPEGETVERRESVEVRMFAYFWD